MLYYTYLFEFGVLVKGEYSECLHLLNVGR